MLARRAFLLSFPGFSYSDLLRGCIYRRLSAFIGVFIEVFFKLIGSAALSLALCGGVGAANFSFGALGDLPYSQDEEARFPALLAEMGREELAFIVHVGDFKRATETC